MAISRKDYGCLVTGLLIFIAIYGIGKWNDSKTRVREEAAASERESMLASLRPTRHFYPILEMDVERVELRVVVDALYRGPDGYAITWPYGSPSGTKRIQVWSISRRHIKSPDDLRIFLSAATEKLAAMKDDPGREDRYELREAAGSSLMALQKTGNSYQEGNRQGRTRAYYSLDYPYSGWQF